MIVHVNGVQQGIGERASEMLRALLALVEGGRLEPRLLSGLRVHFDWIQYRSSFREPVVLRRAAAGRAPELAEIAVDLRRATPAELAAALEDAGAETPPEVDGRVWLEAWRPLGASVIWSFNRLFWQRLAEWEAATGRGFEEALPSGRSDANHPDSVADAVADFWTLLRELEKRGQLPAEIFALEIGVGTGARAALWLDRFRALDDERGTGYYPRLRFLLGDYSMPTLERALATLGHHRESVSILGMDALNPLRALAFLRYKILSIHLTNVYDNLPTDELVRRDGRLYLVEVRAYVPAARVPAVAAAAGVAPGEVADAVRKLLDGGADALGDRERGTAFWRAVWDALRLEERLVGLDSAAHAPMPAGLDYAYLESLLEGAPADVRFHLCGGAVESFVNTLPLLHPRGYLQIQDIFVTEMDEYRRSFRGPGKVDGSVVNWVNGALLRVVAARAGYDVHFAPFRYRPGSRTSILYTTQRD